MPPNMSLNPRERISSSIAFAFFMIWRAYSLYSGLRASAKAIALAAMLFSCGPPWKPGKTDLSMAFLRCCLHMIMPPRGPLSVLWVVVVTRSKSGTGLFISPAAISPAMCAMSAIVSAPTSSATFLTRS